MNEIGMCLTDDEIKSMTKTNFKKTLKENILKSAFKYLQSLKTNHSKVKIIKYDKLEVQPYITSNKLSTEEKQLLQRLRSSTIDVKSCFKSQYSDLSCNLCGDVNSIQTPSHLLDCKEMLNQSPLLFNNDRVQHNDIYGTIDQQKEITRIYVELLQIKTKIEEQIND